MRLDPAALVRRALPKVWGGRALQRVPGIALPPGEAIGETWELYDRPGGASPIRGARHSLADLMHADRAALLGRDVAPGHGGRFPLLVKYIDAADRLSVQVHPDAQQARAEDDGGKTEAWVVLEAGPRARIVRGLRPGVGRAEFAAVAHTAAVEDLLSAFRPAPGDAVYVPAGTVHAIGPDVVLFEIQQNSDVTYRLWDWGRPRETHLERGLAAVRFDLPPATTTTPAPAPGGGHYLIDCPSFRVLRLTITAPHDLPGDDVCRILNVLAGAATLTWPAATTPMRLHPGDTILIPAATPIVRVTPAGELTLLISEPTRS